jgi:hypothetical protein
MPRQRQVARQRRRLDDRKIAKVKAVQEGALGVSPEIPITNIDRMSGGHSKVVNIDEIPEVHVLKQWTVGHGESGVGIRLPQIGSIQKLFIKVEGGTITGGTTPEFTTRAYDEMLKSFKITINDSFFGKREVITGTYALMALRQVRRTVRGKTSAYGEFVIEFPNRGEINAMLPAGASIEFTMDYTMAGLLEVVDETTHTSWQGVQITLSALRYQKVYPPNASIEIKNKTVSISATGDAEVEFPDSHLYKRISFIQYETGNALADIQTKILLDNFGRQVADYRPASWRVLANDLYQATPDAGILISEHATPMLSKELTAILTISNSTDVELYALTEEIELLNA